MGQSLKKRLLADSYVSPPETTAYKPPVLREYRMKFEKVRRGQKAVRNLDRLGVRSKLGGKPDWIQPGETPKCPECKYAMSFVAQIDSIEHDEPYNPHRINALSPRQQYMFGDVGMIYVFLCFKCLRTKSTVQYG